MNPGIHFGDLKLVEKWVARGMRFVTFQYDSKLLLDAFEESIQRLRSFTDQDS
ncbi:hypothetical protein MYX75_03265 [Acidobacteria bacterium AH-259-A15]|nr:hypothetical protein [Acidobacteria bacterium AH-259-A15]